MGLSSVVWEGRTGLVHRAWHARISRLGHRLRRIVLSDREVLVHKWVVPLHPDEVGGFDRVGLGPPSALVQGVLKQKAIVPVA